MMKTVTHTFNVNKQLIKINQQIHNLKSVRKSLEMTKLAKRNQKKYVVVLGYQPDTDQYALYCIHRNKFCLSFISSQLLVHEDSAYLLTASQINQLYHSIYDRKLRRVAKVATMTFPEFIHRLYLK